MADSYRNLTAANSSLVVTLDGIGGIVVEEWAQDNMWSTEPIKFTETQMTGDGRLVAAYVPVVIPFSFTVKASSPCNAQLLAAYIMIQQNAEPARATIALTPNNKSLLPITFREGFFVSAPIAPNGGKTLGDMKYSFEFGKAE